MEILEIIIRNLSQVRKNGMRYKKECDKMIHKFVRKIDYKDKNGILNK